MTETVQIAQTTRFDRNLALNANDFSVFKNYSNLVKDLCVYMAYRYNNTKDLFENGKLDPHEFAEMFGYSRENLFRNINIDDTHDKRIPFTEVNSKKYFLDTVLEYALYLMVNKVMEFSFGGVTFKGETKINYSSIKLLDGFEITIAKNFGEKKGKRTYFFKPSEIFVNNLFRCFVNVNINILPEFRGNNSTDLYLYLLTIQNVLTYKKNNGNEEVYTPQFDLLASLANISIVSPSDKKRKLTAKIERILKIASLYLEFAWGGDGKFKYTPTFKLSETFNLKSLPVDPIYERHKILYQRKAETFFNSDKNLFEKFDFRKWFDDKTINKKEKAICWVEAYNIVFNYTITIDSKEVRREFGEFRK